MTAPHATELEWAWMAGLLEGEGTFQSHPNVQLALKMTDRDVVAKAAELMGADVQGCRVYPPQRPQWRARCCGEKALTVMRGIRPFMGSRRGARIDECLDRWEGRTGNTGVQNNNSKLNPQKVILIRHLAARGVSQARLAKAAGVSPPVVSKVVLSKAWKHVVAYGD